VDRQSRAGGEAAPTGRVIVLNGTSSAGKTSLARALQDRLDEWWLLFGIDTLITAMPWRMFGTADGHTIRPDGSIVTGPGWRRAHDRWRASIGTLVRSGANVLLDEVFLEGAKDQARWRDTLGGVGVTWVGVRCDVEVAAAREEAVVTERRFWPGSKQRSFTRESTMTLLSTPPPCRQSM
jgi:chloramphenicol 3-O phosphotransferase